MIERAVVHTGMQVRDAAGTKLGRVTSFDEGTIRVEKRSVFGDREYLLRYADVAEAAGDELRLLVSQEDLRARLGTETDEGPGPDGLLGIETDVIRTDLRGTVTRYEEYVVGVSAEGGDVEERSIMHALPNRHLREEPSACATGPGGSPGDEDPPIPRSEDEDEEEEEGRAPDLAPFVAEHP